jgi:hypothetical protein
MGAWRLRSVLEDELDPENEKQRIRIEPIFDADTSVYFDVNSKRMDKSDARYAFKLVPMSPEAFEREWPKAPALSSWPQATYSTGVFDWVKPDLVYVAEDAQIGYPPVRLMSPPDMQFHPWTMGLRQAMESILTGDSLSGAEAAQKGWANRAYAADRLEAEVLAIAQRVSLLPSELAAINKRSVHSAM